MPVISLTLPVPASREECLHRVRECFERTSADWW